MPVYLCQSGSGYSEPWRHGIQVYAAPFPINVSGSSTSLGGGRDSIVLPATTADAGHWQTQGQQQAGQRGGTPAAALSLSQTNSTAEQRLAGMPIRRVRHAEVVLVDDVCVAFGRYWLRLRWPGQGEGFAGYIAMGLVGNNVGPKPNGRFPTNFGTLGLGDFWFLDFLMIYFTICLLFYRNIIFLYNWRQRRGDTATKRPIIEYAFWKRRK